MFEFRKKSIEERIRVLSKIDQKKHIAVIVEGFGRCKKFLCGFDTTFGGLMHMVRGTAKLDPNCGLVWYIYKYSVDGTWIELLPKTGETLSQIRNNHVSEDGFLYVYVTKENMFG